MVGVDHHYNPDIRIHLTGFVGDDADEREKEFSTDSIVELAELLVATKEKIDQKIEESPTLIECTFQLAEPPILVGQNEWELTFNYKGNIQTKRLIGTNCHHFEPDLAYFIYRLELDAGIEGVVFFFQDRDPTVARVEVSFDMLGTKCQTYQEFLDQLFQILSGVVEELQFECP